MTPSNLPPGVTESMLPGNRPEDEAFEKWAEKVEDNIDETITDVINNDAILLDKIDNRFFVDVDFHNTDPAVQAHKIEQFVLDWKEVEDITDLKEEE